MTITVVCVAFDCADALVVGRFWSAAVGRPLDGGATSGFASIGFRGRRTEEGWASVDRDADPTWLFAQVSEPKTVKNRMHVDVGAADPEADIARLVGLGATRLADRSEYGYSWTLMSDPEGNEFDLGRAL